MSGGGGAGCCAAIAAAAAAAIAPAESLAVSDTDTRLGEIEPATYRNGFSSALGP
jgi:hypothetical protein